MGTRFLTVQYLGHDDLHISRVEKALLREAQEVVLWKGHRGHPGLGSNSQSYTQKRTRYPTNLLIRMGLGFESSMAHDKYSA